MIHIEYKRGKIYHVGLGPRQTNWTWYNHRIIEQGPLRGSLAGSSQGYLERSSQGPLPGSSLRATVLYLIVLLLIGEEYSFPCFYYRSMATSFDGFVLVPSSLLQSICTLNVAWVRSIAQMFNGCGHNPTNFICNSYHWITLRISITNLVLLIFTIFERNQTSKVSSSTYASPIFSLLLL